MGKILLLLEHKENRRLLSIWLKKRHEVYFLDSDEELSQLLLAFDLCILDGRALDKLNNWVLAIKEAQKPVFLPFLLVTSRRDVGMITRHLWRSIDELIISPIEKLELQARVEMLLQRRQLSLQLKLANENLQQLDKFKTHFISLASHELNNPLNIISGCTQLLSQDRDTNKLTDREKQALLDRITKSIKKMTDTLDSVLVLTRGELAEQNFNPAPLDLNKFCSVLVQEIQLGAASSHSIDLFIQNENDARAIAYVDEKLLHHILTNLLTNAIKYSPKGSAIELELICRKEEIIFNVKDQGIGIPLEDRQRLFNSFHRASNVGKVPGTGLGLAIVRQSVDLHGGKITFESKVGVGTVFTVTLPISLTQSKINADVQSS